MIKIGLKTKDGKPFDINDLAKNIKKSKTGAVYGIPKKRNRHDSALHLAVNVLGSATKNIAPADCLMAPVQKNREKVIQAYQRAFTEEMTKRKDVKDILHNLGKIQEKATNKMCFSIIEDVVKPTIMSNGSGYGWRRLLPATIKKKKGSDQRYYTTGTLLSCLGWEIKK